MKAGDLVMLSDRQSWAFIVKGSPSGNSWMVYNPRWDCYLWCIRAQIWKVLSESR